MLVLVRSSVLALSIMGSQHSGYSIAAYRVKMHLGKLNWLHTVPFDRIMPGQRQICTLQVELLHRGRWLAVV